MSSMLSLWFLPSVIQQSETEAIEEWCTAVAVLNIKRLMQSPPDAVYNLNLNLQIDIKATYVTTEDVLIPSIKTISYINYFLKQLSLYEAVSVSTFNKITEPQRKRIISVIQNNGGAHLNVRENLDKDVLTDDEYQHAMNTIKTFMANKGYGINDQETSMLAGLKDLYSMPAFYVPHNTRYYISLLRESTNEDGHKFVLISDDRSNILDTAIDDYMFILSLKNLTLRWKAVILDTYGWLTYSLNETVDRFAYAVLQVPTCARYWGKLIDACVFLNTRVKLRDASLGRSLEDIYRQVVENMIQMASYLVSTQRIICLDYIKYKICSWKNPARYSIQRRMTENGPSATLVDFDDFEFENPLLNPILYHHEDRLLPEIPKYPLYDTYIINTGFNYNDVVINMSTYKLDVFDLAMETFETWKKKKESYQNLSRTSDELDFSEDSLSLKNLNLRDSELESSKMKPFTVMDSDDAEFKTEAAYTERVQKKNRQKARQKTHVKTVLINNEQYEIDEAALKKLRSILSHRKTDSDIQVRPVKMLQDTVNARSMSPRKISLSVIPGKETHIYPSTSNSSRGIFGEYPPNDYLDFTKTDRF